MRPPFTSQIFERAQALVDRRRLVIGLCAAVVIALVAAIPGLLTSADGGKNVRTAEFAQVSPTTIPAAGVVSPAPGAPFALAPSPTTTQPARVLGSSFTRGPTTTAPRAAPKAAPKPATKSAPPTPNATTPTTRPPCRNSFDPACGLFSWDPAPAAPNQPRDVSLSGPPNQVTVGEQVTIHSIVNDPDDSQAFQCPIASYDFGDGPAMSTHCDPPPNTDPCPKRYGPWTPPAANPGGGQEDVAHTFSRPGTYTVTFDYKPGVYDACYNPYASEGSGTMTITVFPAPSPSQ